MWMCLLRVLQLSQLLGGALEQIKQTVIHLHFFLDCPALFCLNDTETLWLF